MMDSYDSSSPRVRQLAGKLLQELEPYRVDEGYSEETRSPDGSEASVRLEGGDDALQPPSSASFEHLLRGLSECERVDIAYGLLRGLKASSIARIFDQLWPLFHKDPLQILPPEIMSLVLSYLEPHDLLNVSLVSSPWRERVTDGTLWRKKFHTEGWSLDTDEIAKVESILQHANYSVQPPYTWRCSPDQKSFDALSDRGLPETTPENSQMDIDCSQDSQTSHGDLSSIRPRTLTSNNEERLPDLQETPALITASSLGRSRINYHYIFKQKRRLEDNWDKGRFHNFQLPHREAPHEAHEECVYTLQFQGNYLVSGSRDKTLRIWNLSTGRLARRPLRGHVGSVLCLQFDSSLKEDLIVSGSSDTNVILWRFSTGEMIRKITAAHSESVLNLRFDHRYLVTCSKDKMIKIWNRHTLRPGDADYPKKGHPGGGQCPAYILDDPVASGISRWQPSQSAHLMELEPYMHLMTLSLHGAAVNAIQIYEDQLVSASGDRTLRMWDIHTGQSLSRMPAHEKGIACVQYDGKRIVSGSSDNSIRIWDPASKTEVARLEGHSRLVRTLQAAFADEPGGRENLEAEAAEVDRQWQAARDQGEELKSTAAIPSRRPGSRKPRDLRAVGAKIPPSGGGSRWARIISGSYDEKVIVWKKNSDDEWVINHMLAQEEALTAAGPPILPRAQINAYVQPDAQPPSSTAATAGSFNTSAPPNGSNEASPSSRLHHRSASTAPSFHPHRSEAVNAARQWVRARGASATLLQGEVSSHDGAISAASHRMAPSPLPETNDTGAPRRDSITSTQPAGQSTHTIVPAPAPVPQAPVNSDVPPAALDAVTRHLHLPATPPNARIFKLQFDARRIICCSQDNKIVGWDFANEDEDIMACSRFFADPQ